MQNETKLTNAAKCLEAVFPDVESRPCPRTFQGWKAKRIIPFVKVGRSVFFDPAKVRAALERKFEVQPK